MLDEDAMLELPNQVSQWVRREVQCSSRYARPGKLSPKATSTARRHAPRTSQS